MCGVNELVRSHIHRFKGRLPHCDTNQKKNFFLASVLHRQKELKKNLISRSIYTSSPVDSATFYDPRSIFSFTFRPKQNPTWKFEWFFSEFDGFEPFWGSEITLYQCKIDQKHHLQALEIVSTIENRIQNQVRHPNRLHGEGNSRFRKPRVTVGQQSFKYLKFRETLLKYLISGYHPPTLGGGFGTEMAQGPSPDHVPIFQNPKIFRA